MASAVMAPVSITSDISTILGQLSADAAPWYNAVTLGAPVATSASQVALTQASIQQQQQLQLQQVPVVGQLLAGLSANPLLVLGALVLAIVAIIWAVK